MSSAAGAERVLTQANVYNCIMNMHPESRHQGRFNVGDEWNDQTIESVEEVGSAVADVAIRPTLLRDGERLVLAYYDGSRRLTIADRTDERSDWTFQRVDSTVGWDSHNYIDLGIDRSGRLHIAGNMHASALQYWIADSGGASKDIRRLEVLSEAAREQRVTYPRFLRENDGNLLFTYRNGTPGDGDFVCLRWNDEKGRYEPMTDGPLIEGRGKRNAYIDTNAPILGPDGSWHMLWVWRDSPEAESTHTVNYARSADLLNWTDAAGRRLGRPLVDCAGIVVDPVGPEGGLINNNVRLGFFPDGRPTAIYHKRDDAGSQQVWAAVFDGDEWARRQITAWNYRWDFSGRGSLDFKIEIGAPTTTPTGVAVDVRREEEVQTFCLSEELSTTSLEIASPWNPLRRVPRDNGLFDRATPGRGWTPASPGPGWFMLHTSVLDQRDQQPVGQAPAAEPLVLVKTSRSAGD